MNTEELRQSAQLPEGLPPLRQALWHEAHGDWERAHGLAQDISGPEAAWVHAYLHRVEGDLSNADYWYRRAARPPARGPLNEEWHEIATALSAL